MAQDFQEQDDPNVVWGSAPEQSEPVISRWNPFLMLKWVAICGGFLTIAAVGVAYLVYSHNESSAMKKKMNEMEDRLLYAQQSASQVPPRNADSSPVSAQANDYPRPASRDESELRAMEKIALSKAALAGFEEQLNKLESDYRGLVSTRQQINLEIANFLTGENGKRISSDEKLIEQFLILQNRSKVSNQESPEIPSFVKEMRPIIEQAKLKPEMGFRMSEDSVSRLKSLSSQLDPVLLVEKDILLGLTSLVAATSNLPVGADLSLAIKKLEADQRQAKTEETNRIIKLEDEKTLKASALLIAEANRELAESKTALEVGKLNAEKLRNADEAARLKLATQAALEAARINAADQKLRTEYASSKAEIRRYLMPFVSEGRTLRGGAEGKGPMSYAYILGSGALNKGDAGLLRLFELGGIPYNPGDPGINDREVGGFPEYKGGKLAYYSASLEYLEKAQGFLNKFGELMIEDGLLAK